MSNPATQDKHVLADDVWVRHCSRPLGISNSAIRKNKDKSVMAAIVDNEESFRKMETADGDNILEYLRKL